MKDIIKKAEEKSKNGDASLLESLAEFSCSNKKDGAICSVKLGTKLRKFLNRIENAYKLEITGKSQNADMWRVTKIRSSSFC